MTDNNNSVLLDQVRLADTAAQIKEEETGKEERILALRARIEQLESQLITYQTAKGFLQEIGDSVASAVRALDPFPAIKIPKTKDICESPISAVLKLSDWHIGEIVSAAETDGFGSYNLAIARDRIAKLAEKLIGWAHTNRRSFRIEDLHIFGECDYISGDIHDELRITNEFPVPVQVAEAGDLIAWLVQQLAPHFKQVVFHGLSVDNHSRRTHKPQYKQRALNNESYLVNRIAQKALSRHSNVDFRIYSGIRELVTVANHRFLIEHGDEIKAWLGIPYYGMSRLAGKEARRRMNAAERGYHYQSFGHWHVPSIIEGNMLVNGSLNGTTEYDHGQGRHSRPAQVSMLVHPQYGIFSWTPWRFKEGATGNGNDNGNGGEGAQQEGAAEAA